MSPEAIRNVRPATDPIRAFWNKMFTLVKLP